ncbi:MAG: MaoC family dehydratase N-terminal domain-containing protein [Chloroflexi bacterium]|nr:MaoC family dehydratase N-terminal domain-containing protein [Chloroflexota bacterium]
MPEEPEITFSQLEVGYQFPPRRFQLDRVTVADYLKAVEDESRLYQDTDLVPPMAVAACALKALTEDVTLPPGTIHLSQELQFMAGVSVSDNLTNQARVSRQQRRGKLHLLDIKLNVFNQNQEKVLDGTSSFMLPE